uniref:Uncharacterized protein n=1 Tax=Acanthochromis polyacanthus TaxID=80966 RepID=A0A3Q1G0T0_9TELE
MKKKGTTPGTTGAVTHRARGQQSLTTLQPRLTVRPLRIKLLAPRRAWPGILRCLTFIDLRLLSSPVNPPSLPVPVLNHKKPRKRAAETELVSNSRLLGADLGTSVRACVCVRVCGRSGADARAVRGEKYRSNGIQVPVE